MSTPTLQINQPGMLSTVQDTGRYGYQRFGMPTAGAMDTFALRAANALLGNDLGAAGIEATVLGPRIILLADTRIAITGANVSPTVDREPIPMWQAVPVRKGSRLEFHGPKDGMRAYLAVAGGIDVPVIMGSRSTYMKAAIGGLDGRQLRSGDILNAFGDALSALRPSPGFPTKAIPKYGVNHELRVVLGPQNAAFTQSGIDTFLNSTYTVSINSDRMGYRLEGEPIEHVTGPDVISDGTPLGAIQVPGSGEPIILLADRGTTGGYTKIATVISADISKIAQAMPGHTITFSAVSVEEAQEAHRKQEELLHSVLSGSTPSVKLAVVMNDDISDILGEDGKPLNLPISGESAVHLLNGKVRIGGTAFELQINARRIDSTSMPDKAAIKCKE